MFASAFDPARPGSVLIAGAPPGHDARVLASVALRTHGKPLIHVALDEVRAAFLEEALGFFAPSVEVLSFPAWDCLPYDRVSPQAALVARRLATLERLRHPFSRPAVLLTTVNALGQKVLPPEALAHAGLSVAAGDELSVEKLRRYLAANGYVAAGTVREPGDYAVRGGIVDLFPPGTEAPVRLDFFGDTVETLRVFDPLTQSSTGSLDRLALLPVGEVLLDERAIAAFRSLYRQLFGILAADDPLVNAITGGRPFPGMEHWLGLFVPRLVPLLDYAPVAPVSWDHQVPEALRARRQQVEDFYQARRDLYEAAKRAPKGAATVAATYKPAPLNGLYLEILELEALWRDRATAELSPFASAAPGGLDAQGARGPDFSGARARSEGEVYAALKEAIARHHAEGRRVFLACYSQGSAERVGGILRAHGVDVPEPLRDVEAARGLDPKRVLPALLGLEHGFVAPDMAVVTEQDILGDRLVRAPRRRKASASFRLELGALEPGDFVVHAEHGIGRYEGLETVLALGLAHDCVRLVYEGGDKLFVPVENLDVLSRYGAADCGATLDKLGGVAWQARKARVKKRLKDMAEALLKIAAERHLRPGEAILSPGEAAEEFAARFPYAETEDQAQAIADVEADLASGRPMDRLVCGDVGFGKTEVALRAAFAATQAGMQVAVVVPTTLLARQHMNHFTRRFSGFPVRIAQLSRMVSTAEATAAKEGLKSGAVGIVIGTHALLASDIAFHRLGLLIVDEEQHFGVKQKERLKQLRADVHVLTLTATPIPRTLQLAMAGVRELSLIATPPVDRLAVRTFALPWDPLVIREALMREHFRGGQSFCVCPRIEDLDGVAATLRELVPELRLRMAHGRMSATELDDIMTGFDAGQFDLLLATNIIESGLDIPNANTIIVHRADLFGLAQLYQLRGRVGRARQRGYAYLTYAADALLTPTAQQRLGVIQTLDQLGAGFQLASHDMDIRGAGNLLGEEQSGHIREVGIELYQQMLEDAVAVARAGGAAAEKRASAGEDGMASGERWMPQISVGLPVLIPETYVADLNVRLGLYRRLAEAGRDVSLEALAAEMIDRFGPLPKEVENLLRIVEIKGLCLAAGVAKLDAGPRGGVIGFHRDSFARPERLVAWIGQQAGTVRVRPDQKLVLVRAWDDLDQRLTGVRKTLAELAALTA